MTLFSTDSGYDSVQFTLVDCPGHASLIRTIIGGMLIIVCLLLLFCFSNVHRKFYIYSVHVGAQIIDLMLLVVDAIKGIQTQTAEVSAHYGVCNVYCSYVLF